MRLLMTVAADPNVLANCYRRGLPAGAAEVHTIDLTSNVRPSTATRVLKRLAPQLVWRGANRRLLKSVHALEPDVVWIFKGMEVYPQTLKRLKAMGVTLVNYNADHPFEFFSRGSGNSNIRRAVPLYDLHMTYSHKIAAELRKTQPKIPVAIVPFGHEVDDAAFAAIAGQEEVMRACFLGNPDERRRSGIETLVAAGIPVDVYGHGWDRFLEAGPLMRIHGPALGTDMLATLARYRVQLNYFRPHNIDSHNMRTFEVPACGGIMLAQDSAEHRAFFEAGREAFYFANPQQMIDEARRLLALPKPAADAIRAAARKRSVDSGYAYADRAKAALAAIMAHMRTQ